MARWIQNRNPPYNLIPEEEYVPDELMGGMVVGDLPDFRSPVTGEIIRGRAGMRRHMREHNLAHQDDFKQHWKDAGKERADYFAGKSQKHRREIREALIEAVKRSG